MAESGEKRVNRLELNKKVEGTVVVCACHNSGRSNPQIDLCRNETLSLKEITKDRIK